MTVSWAEETKESRPVGSRLRQAFAIVVVANLLFPALNGILGIFFENKLAFVIWLFGAALLVLIQKRVFSGKTSIVLDQPGMAFCSD